MGFAVSWERWDTGRGPGPAQWVKDLALLQLRLRWRLQLSSDPWPENSVCCGEAKKKNPPKKSTMMTLINKGSQTHYSLQVDLSALRLAGIPTPHHPTQHLDQELGRKHLLN